MQALLVLIFNWDEKDNKQRNQWTAIKSYAVSTEGQCIQWTCVQVGGGRFLPYIRRWWEEGRSEQRLSRDLKKWGSELCRWSISGSVCENIRKKSNYLLLKNTEVFLCFNLYLLLNGCVVSLRLNLFMCKVGVLAVLISQGCYKD